MDVQPNTTVLLRVINAGLNTHLFFKVAGHAFTVVAVDACYTANYTTDTLVLAPGHTVDALMVTNASAGSYYMAVQAYDSLSPTTMAVTDDTTATAIVRYNTTSTKKNATPVMPTMPQSSDSATANAFYFGLRGPPSPSAPAVPTKVDVNMTIELGLGQLPCDSTQSSCSGKSVAAAMNGVSFRLPSQMSLLEAQFNRTPGVYTADFPDAPQPSGTPMVEGTKVRRLKYNSTVEIVLQNPTAFPSENHPIHLHGFNFFVLAQGLGNFTPGNVSGYNLVDPVSRNTLAVPTGGWAVIRFVANNPGRNRTVAKSVVLLRPKLEMGCLGLTYGLKMTGAGFGLWTQACGSSIATLTRTFRWGSAWCSRWITGRRLTPSSLRRLPICRSARTCKILALVSNCNALS